MADEVKRCPFCDSDGQVNEADDRFFVICRSVDCFCSLGEGWDGYCMPDHAFPTREAAIAAWNRRALPGEGDVERRPNIGASTDEPSLREIVYSYYDAHFDSATALRHTDEYFAALVALREEGQDGD